MIFPGIAKEKNTKKNYFRKYGKKIKLTKIFYILKLFHFYLYILKEIKLN